MHRFETIGRQVYNYGHMRYVFLTSSPTGPLDGSRPVYGLDEMNGFAAGLRACWPAHAHALMIAAFPDAYAQNDEMCGFFRGAFARSGLQMDTLDLCDSRYAFSPEEILSYDCIILSGGHVPTENRFFRSLGLREIMQQFDGIVIGISAGTMNAADEVYVQPEEEGESRPEFCRSAEGLNLTKINILPHYQMVKDHWLDGKRLFEDITYADSYGKEFLCLEDGSYVYIAGGKTWICGRSWRIADGQLFFLQDTDEVKEY